MAFMYYAFQGSSCLMRHHQFQYGLKMVGGLFIDKLFISPTDINTLRPSVTDRETHRLIAHDARISHIRGRHHLHKYQAPASSQMRLLHRPFAYG